MTKHERAFILWLGRIADYLNKQYKFDLVGLLKQHPEIAEKSAWLLYEEFKKGTSPTLFAESIEPSKFKG